MTEWLLMLCAVTLVFFIGTCIGQVAEDRFYYRSRPGWLIPGFAIASFGLVSVGALFSLTVAYLCFSFAAGIAIGWWAWWAVGH